MTTTKVPPTQQDREALYEALRPVWEDERDVVGFRRCPFAEPPNAHPFLDAGLEDDEEQEAEEAARAAAAAGQASGSGATSPAGGQRAKRKRNRKKAADTTKAATTGADPELGLHKLEVLTHTIGELER